MRLIQCLTFAVLISNFSGPFFIRSALGGGTVTNCTQADLEAAMAAGGTVFFECDGTITLTNTIIVSQNTALDGSGRVVTISGGNLVRLFEMVTVDFSLKSLT